MITTLFSERKLNVFARVFVLVADGSPSADDIAFARCVFVVYTFLSFMGLEQTRSKLTREAPERNLEL